MGFNAANDEYRKTLLACLVLFYTPSAKDMKVIFENYAGDLTNEEKQRFLKKLKEVKYSHLDFSLRYPFEIEMHKP